MDTNILIDLILSKEIVPTLTDFSGNQLVFLSTFRECERNNTPIKTVLELGVYRLPGEPNSPLPGQSTKTLMALSNFFEFKHVSLDIDDCSSTIENCKKWCKERGLQANNHKFVQSNSILFDIKSEFPDGIDFIFLDTNHDDTYPERIGYANSGGKGMTYKEICYYAPHLTKNGRFFMHDTKNYYSEKEYGVNTQGAVDRFLNENKDWYFTEHNTNVHGLGELRRI